MLRTFRGRVGAVPQRHEWVWLLRDGWGRRLSLGAAEVRWCSALGERRGGQVSIVGRMVRMPLVGTMLILVALGLPGLVVWLLAGL